MIYLYDCEICGEFEYEHSIKDSLPNCPNCGSIVKRLINNNCKNSFVYNEKTGKPTYTWKVNGKKI